MDFQDQGYFIISTFSRRYVFEIWSSITGTRHEKHQHLIQIVLASLDEAENIDIKHLDSRLLALCKCLDRYWKIVNRTKSALLDRYCDWLNEIECVKLVKNSSNELCIQENVNQPGPSRGRPKKDFSELSKRSKRRRLAELSQVDNSTVNSLLNTSDKSNTSLEHNISADEVLSVIVEAKLTKHQYLLIKEFINSKTSCNILPSYQSVLTAKKKCYPENVSVTESKAEIELQSLLDHTTSRILESQTDILDKVPTDSTDNLTLIGKWGFDGSTGQSEYKQRFSDPSCSDDSSLFVTMSYVPLQLVVNTPTDSIIIWKNPRPSSTRYCRPIRFQFLKESSEVSKEEEAYFREKINNLTPATFSFNNRDFSINHSLQLTMVDGKVCTSLSDSSSCKCYICGATPKEMNKIDICLQKQPDESRYEFGLSPLHSWIRFFEYFVHLAYKINVKKWQARSDEEKKEVADRKLHIQKQFRLRLGLIVDKPRSGGSGTSNDGNTARTFFNNSEISAEITGLRKDLIDRCSTILHALSSGFNINLDKFDEYAFEITRLLIQEYPWYNLPASVHKVLIHGAKVARYALLSIGELSEEAAESNNKHYKAFRRDHTRKMSREVANRDLLNRLLLSSDPFITSLRKLPRKKKSLMSKQVLELLRV